MYQILMTLVVPPTSLLIYVVIFYFLFRKSTFGRAMISSCIFLLYIFSTPLLSTILISRLAIFPPLPATGPIAPTAQAIVILSAEAQDFPEFPSPSPGPLTLERLRYGARLQRRTNLPILVSGGTLPGQSTSLASAMRQSLAEDFNLPVAWEEDQSQDTHQNALDSAAILKAQGITRIILVTHAWHMPRAKLAFERAGLTVLPAPTASSRNELLHDIGVTEYIKILLPSAKAFQESYFAIHEMFGFVFYFVTLR